MIFKALCFCVAFSVMACAVANSEIQKNDVTLLPIKVLRAVVVDGKTVFVSENGRFIIKGDLYDVWQKKRIADFTEMQKLSTHIDLKNIGLDIGALNNVSMGAPGAKDVVIFVSPLCQNCNTLVKKAKNLTSEYRFQLVFISGDESVKKIIGNIIGASSSDTAIEAVINNRTDKLPDVAHCDSKRHAMTMLMAQLMGIDKVPFIIAPDGRFHKGLPQNLSAWLEGKS